MIWSMRQSNKVCLNKLNYWAKKSILIWIIITNQEKSTLITSLQFQLTDIQRMNVWWKLRWFIYNFDAQARTCTDAHVAQKQDFSDAPYCTASVQCSSHIHSPARMFYVSHRGNQCASIVGVWLCYTIHRVGENVKVLTVQQSLLSCSIVFVDLFWACKEYEKMSESVNEQNALFVILHLKDSHVERYCERFCSVRFCI